MQARGEKPRRRQLPVSLALRRRCEALRKQSQTVVNAAGASPGKNGLDRTDVAKLPRFGLCQTAGLGAWALELQKLEATGTASTRVVHATFGVAHVDPQGEVRACPVRHACVRTPGTPGEAAHGVRLRR